MIIHTLFKEISGYKRQSILICHFILLIACHNITTENKHVICNNDSILQKKVDGDRIQAQKNFKLLNGKWIIRKNFSLIRTMDRKSEGWLNETLTIGEGGIFYDNDILENLNIPIGAILSTQKPVGMVFSDESITFPYIGLDSNYISESLLRILDCESKEDVTFINTSLELGTDRIKIFVLEIDRIGIYYGDNIFIAIRFDSIREY
jgi:hypothetical protein